MSMKTTALSMRVEAPAEAADQMGKAIQIMAQEYLEMVERAGNTTSGPIFMSCLLGTVAGFCVSELGTDSTVVLLDHVKGIVASAEAHMAELEARAH